MSPVCGALPIRVWLVRSVLIAVLGLLLVTAVVLIFGFEGRAQTVGYALMTASLGGELLWRFADWRRENRR